MTYISTQHIIFYQLMNNDSIELAHQDLLNTIFRVAVEETEQASNDMVLRNDVVQRFVQGIQPVTNKTRVSVESIPRLAAAQEFPTPVLRFVLVVASDTSKDTIHWTRVAYRLLERNDVIGCQLTVSNWYTLIRVTAGELPDPFLVVVSMNGIDRLYFLAAWAQKVE